MSKVKRMKTAELRANLTEALNRILYADEQLILCRRNKELAALVSIEDYKLLQALKEAEKSYEAKIVYRNQDSGNRESIQLKDVVTVFPVDGE